MSKFKTGDIVRIDEPVSKFKVGDKVVEKATGDVGVISYKADNVGQDCWYISWQSGTCVGYSNSLHECDFKLVEETDFSYTALQQAMQGWNVATSEPTNKITSTGGSSDYYKLIINGNHVETEDVIYAMVGGDFALGNALKALRRMYLDSLGGGKEGVDMSYDANKVKYFVDSFVKRFGEINAD